MIMPFSILLTIIYLTNVACQVPPLPAYNQVCLIVPPDVEQCYQSFQGKPIDDKAAQVNCLQKLLWNFTPDTNNTQAELDYFRSLAGDISSYTTSSILRNGNPRPPTGRRARQEYRTLTQEERQKFHIALNKLYEAGTIRAFARLYARAYHSHHNGASFPAWNRIFLIMFEEALRRIDPTVALPFWDCTIDHDMDNPVNSAIWTPEYFGNGINEVVTGAAAGWVTDRGNLERNYGHSSRLLSKDQIRTILSKCELQQISQPTADIGYDFELYINGPKVWVGGDLASPATAGYDPIFYMHHAFADYIWELFRRRQYRRCGIDPSQDYPNVPAGNSHAPDSPMTGFDWLTNADGLKHYWIDNWYYYESTPACPNCCRGCSFPAPINCDRRRRVCVARSRRTFDFGPKSVNTNPAKAFAQASLEPLEIEALSEPSPHRNRGLKFLHLPNDGRLIHTAISDAFAAANIGRTATQRTQGQLIDNRNADSRGSLRRGINRSSRRTIPDGWGPPPKRRTFTHTRNTGSLREPSNTRINPSARRTTSNDATSQTEGRTGTSSQFPERWIVADPRGSSATDIGGLTNSVGTPAGRTLSDRRAQIEARISADSRNLLNGRGQGRFAAYSDTREVRQSIDTAKSDSSQSISPIKGPSLSQNLFSTDQDTFSAPGKISTLDLRHIKVAARSPRKRGRKFDVPK